MYWGIASGFLLCIALKINMPDHNMYSNIFPIMEVALFLSWLVRQFWRKLIRYENDLITARRYKFQNLQFLGERQDLSELVLVFSVEGALLRSSSSSSSSGFFPYFMLVAFEAGSIIRASILFAFYPIICLLDAHDLGLRIMVMICFLGLRQDRFTAIGRAVLPKFLLEDVGMESFKVIGRGGKKIGVTNLPLVMVESFLRDYMELDFVVGRELKVFRGYFLGILTENKQRLIVDADQKTPGGGHANMVGITSSFSYNGSPHHHHHLFSLCEEIYMVSEEEKRQWQPLSRDMYPRPLIFHDGRLAFRPAFVSMLVTFMWLPVGLFLCIVRIILGFFPYGIAIPVSAFTGIRLRVTIPAKSRSAKGKGRRLYVCNHRTLLDPVFLSAVLGTSLCALTYSISRLSEFLSPIKTVRLRRDRDEDAKIMENLLSKGDLVVCPEGTTCREPYLLRFSPLFAELISDNNNIVPVAVDSCVSVFHGTTAGGMKFLDPFFFLMNPYPGYAFELLDTAIGRSNTPAVGLIRSKIEVANMVQMDICRALGFESTNFTRKDKYLLLTSSSYGAQSSLSLSSW